MITTQELTVHARFLRNAAPQAFDDFFAAMMRYTDEKTKDLINTTANVALAQGHAQQCVKILEALEKARKDG